MKADYVGRQVIETKYLAPTNFRPGRIRVSADVNRTIIVPWDHEMNAPDNHAYACMRFQSVMGWNDERIGSSLKDGRFVWVCK